MSDKQTMWSYLESVKLTLSDLEGVKTCKIGIEPTLNADSYPMVRLVPSTIVPAKDHYSRRVMTLLIYFGTNTYESQEGIEGVEKQLFIMEQNLREAVKVGSGFKPRYMKTIFDESRLQDTFKVLCLVVEVEGDA